MLGKGKKAKNAKKGEDRKKSLKEATVRKRGGGNVGSRVKA